MLAAVVTGLQTMVMQEVPVPEIDAESILLKVEACSICGSDIRILASGNPRVRYPAVIGHEMAGSIAAVGKQVRGFAIGDRIAIGADVPCGVCDWCRNDQGNCCDTNYAMGYQFAGGFAEYCLLNPVVVKYGPIAPVPASVTAEEAALAEPLACCLNGYERVFFSPGKSVLIIGAGPVGLMLLQLARSFKASVRAVADVEPFRLAYAKKFSPDFIFDSRTTDLIAAGQAATNGKGFDVIFTACAVPEVQEQALRLVAKRGCVNLFGGLAKNSRPIAVISNDIHYREAYVTGSHGSLPRQHKQALDLIARREIDVASLITHRFPLADIQEAFQTAQQKTSMKVVISDMKQ
ncbi:MAG: alcohol dehydrogenase catalytic domain-containing protein [Candidatus Omnitrophica bacterium]|nr:alcohol dehydrogenase catalytic domain-containing protein [Candidatus Omnitrophota bacterium]